MFGESIRRYGFWFADALSGGAVRKNLLDIRRKLKGEIDTSTDDLQRLIHHAVNTTPFYGPFRDCQGISGFPVINKRIIKDKHRQFLSSAFINKPLHKVWTSGTTGERFEVLQNRQKRKRVLAELIHFYEISGFRPGCRYVHIKVWSGAEQKPKLLQIAENLIMFDCSSLSDEAMERLYQLLKRDHSIKFLIGYAASLAAIAFYFDRKGYTPDMFNIEVVTSTAERLESSVKSLLKKVFGCTVVSRYSNRENGVLAQQPVDGDHFIFNTAHYYFETLCLDSDQPAPYGEPARLVLTDLYNYATPFIRYDTEDIVIPAVLRIKGSETKVLKDISGRCDEVVCDTRGNKIHHHFVAIHLDRYDRLAQYQFIQESLKHYTLKLAGARGVYEDEDILKTIGGLVGEDAVIKIEHVDRIPHLSSGKFKKIVCQYMN